MSRSIVFSLALAIPALCAERIIFDTDSGFFTDDGVALVMLARSPRQVTIAGMTLVPGNVWPRQGAEYMFHTLKLLGRTDIPLYLGAREPLVHNAAMLARERKWGALEYIGAFGMPPGELKPPFGGRFTGLKPRAENAVDFIASEVERHPGEVTILALGPMTNIATLLAKKPGIAAGIRQIVFMGGNIKAPGNASREAEFNFWFDPEAARAVLRSAIPKKIMFGLDICNRARLWRRDFDEIVAVKTPITELYAEDRGNRYPGFYRDPKAGAYLWDELAAAWLLDPGFVTKSETAYLDVDAVHHPAYGRTVPLDRALAPAATPVTVMLDLDLTRVLRLQKDLLTR